MCIYLYIQWDQGDSTVGGVYALHVVDPGLDLSTPYDPLSSIRSDL